MKKLLRFLTILFCVAFFLVGVLRLTMLSTTKDVTYTLDTVPAKAVVLVPGAGLNRLGGPSAPLKDRLDAAIKLYN